MLVLVMAVLVVAVFHIVTADVTIQRQIWRWICHTLMKPATNITHLSLEWNPQGASRAGGVKKPWRRTIQLGHKDLGMTWNRVKWTAQNLAHG